MSAPLRPTLLLLSCALAGCAQSGSYPSLLPRPIERGETGTPAPASPASAAARDPAIAARIAQLVGQAHDGQSAFDRSLPDARASVARAGAAGSEGWIAAQEAVSALESARTPTATALADLDALSKEKAQATPAAGEEDLAAIDTAIDEVSALAQAQDDQIGQLSGALASF